jgi:tight adherence protein C
MRKFEEKISLPELTGFIDAVIQADKMGGSIKEIIKAQAAEIRQKRFQYLKKKAHEAPVKLLIPLMLFIFPVIFIILFAPIVIKLIQGI